MKSSCPDVVLPAGEVHLVATQVDVGVWEHRADLLEERAHEVVCGVQNGVHGSEAAGGGWPRVTRCEQIRLAWEGEEATALKWWGLVGGLGENPERTKLTFAPRLRVSRSVKLRDDTDSSEAGKLNHHLHIGRRVHVCVGVVSSLWTREWQLVSRIGSSSHTFRTSVWTSEASDGKKQTEIFLSLVPLDHLTFLLLEAVMSEKNPTTLD